jgi:hypothetical protein
VSPIRALRSLPTLALLALAAAACGDSATKPAPAPAGGGSPAPAPAETPAAPSGGGGAFDAAKATATLTVKATVKGTLPKQRPVSFNADCGKFHTAEVAGEEVVGGEGGTLQNVVVYLSKGAEKWTFPANATEVVLDQRGCMYIPHVFTLQTNQPIKVISSDPVAHNVHTNAKVKGNPDLNETQNNAASPALLHKFPKEEMGLAIKCDIHTWMKTYANVFSHPFHGVTGKDGSVALPKLPAGEYEVSVWHEANKVFPSMPAAQKVTLADGEAKSVEFVFEVK